MLIPIDSPAAWTGADLASRTDWIHVLTPAEVSDVERVAASIVAQATPREALTRDGEPEQGIEHLSVPLDVPSVLRTVLMTRGRYLGPVPPDPTSQKLLADLGRGAPKAAFLYPVEVRERVVAFIYVALYRKLKRYGLS